MMNLKYVELSTYLRERIKDYGLIKKSASIALGIALSRRMPLPTSGVVNPQEHYAQSLKMVVSTGAADFNEQIVVDMDLVEDVARSYWLIRYIHAFPTPLIPLMECADEIRFMGRLSGATHLVNPEVHAFCNEAPDRMIMLINRITDVLDNVNAN